MPIEPGNIVIENNLIKKCLCGNTSNFFVDHINNIDVAICQDCGVTHQTLPNFSTEDLEVFYRQQYHAQHQTDIGLRTYQERYGHDYSLALKRMEKYSRFFKPNSRGLDVGSSNNAFVDAARSQGFQCYGTEIGESIADPTTTYRQSFESCHFPENYFEFITFHDVFEHLVDPGIALKEICRCLSNNGMLIIDFPDYFDSSGQHHWRPIQHLWYPTNDQLINYIEYHGFKLVSEEHPIPGKRVFYFKYRKPQVTPKRFLMLPGMGDIYWTMVKMQDFMSCNQISSAQVDIWDFDDRPRSIEYIDRIPFVTRGNYFKNKEYRDEVFRESYHDGPRSIFPDYKGYDYYFAVNGILRVGHTLDDTSLDIGQYKSDWYFPFFVSLEERMIGERFRQEHGPFIMTHFSSTGMFRHWEKRLPPDQAYHILEQIYRIKGKRIVLTGKYWDSSYNQELVKLDRANILIDMVDKTPLPDFLSMMMASDGMFGWCGGNTVKSTYFRKPTVMLWHDYFPDERFFANCCPPDSLNHWYWPINISRCKADTVLQAVLKAFD